MAGLALILLGGWISATLYVTAGDRVEVVALARDVDQFAEIDRDDLRTVLVSTDPSLETIAGGDVDDLVGRTVALPLVEGSLLSPDQLVPEDEGVVGSDETVVGMELSPNQYPDGVLEQGGQVRVVVVPAEGESGSPPDEFPGWVLRLGGRDDRTRDRHIEVVVSSFSGPEVSAAAIDGRVSLIADGGG